MMITIQPQTIRSPSGEEMVVLTRAEFDAIMRVVTEAMEDADDTAIYDERMAALEAGADAKLPPEVSAHIMKGDSLLRALRRGAGLTLAQLAERANLAPSHLDDLETRQATATSEDICRLARALDIDPTWLGAAPSQG